MKGRGERREREGLVDGTRRVRTRDMIEYEGREMGIGIVLAWTIRHPQRLIAVMLVLYVL